MNSDFRTGTTWIRHHELLSDEAVNDLCKDIHANKAKHGVWIHVSIELPASKTLKEETGKRHSYAWHNALTSDAMAHTVSLAVGPSQWKPYIPDEPADILDEPADEEDRPAKWRIAWFDIPPFKVNEQTQEHGPVLPLIPGTQLVITPHRLSVKYLDLQSKTMLLQDVLGENATPNPQLRQYRDSITPPIVEVFAHRIMGDAIAQDFMAKTSSTLRRENEGAWALANYVPGAPLNDYPLAKAGAERGPMPEARKGLYDKIKVESPKNVDQALQVGMLYTQVKTLDSVAAAIVQKRAPAFYPELVFIEQSRVLDGATGEKLLGVEFRVVTRIGMVIDETMWHVLYGMDQ